MTGAFAMMRACRRPDMLGKRMRMKRGWLFPIVLLAAFVLAACSPDINLLNDAMLSDTSLLSGEPCEAPCWNGIVPGETLYRDAKLIIESDQRYKLGDEPSPEEGSTARSFTFGEGDEGPACCQVVSRDGETVSSFLLQTAPVMNLGPLYDIFGEPDYVAGEQVSEEQGYAALIYADLPLILYAYVASPATGEVSVSSPIIGAMYLMSGEVEELLVCANLYHWRGFTSFTTYAEGEFDYVGDGVGDEDLCPTG